MREFRLAVLILGLAAGQAARAQIAQTFTQSSAPGWTLVGNAYLTVPSIDAAGSGWLRLTDAANNEYGTAQYTGGNFTPTQALVMQFDFVSWGGTGADGTTIYLYDSTKSMSGAEAGGGLGYCGGVGGYLAIGLDEYGNFSNPGDRCGAASGGPGAEPNYLVVRGPYSANDIFVANAAVPGGLWSNTTKRPAANTIYVTLYPLTVGYQITVQIQSASGSIQTLLSNVNFPYAPPNSLSIGIAGSTGGSTNIHEVRNFSLTATQTTALSGTVYSDLNHNSNLDVGETGTGLSGLYVKRSVYSNGVCQTPATVAAAVNTTTGAYSLPPVVVGSYCLTLTNSAALTNTTPYLPPGWVATEAPTGVRTVTVTTAKSAAQNFGLYNGASLTAQVFTDSGAGGGTANDGVQNGAEAGIANVTVTLSAGGTALGSAVTNGSGSAALWIPATTTGTVTVTPTAPVGDVPTGGSAGNSKGSYTRPSVSFTVAAGTTYTGIAFGMIPPNTFLPSSALATQAGSSVFYAHTFTAGSAGQVVFQTAAVANPVLAGWSETLYLDVTCSGQYASGDPLVGGGIAVTAGQKVCLLLKESVPGGAPANAENKVTLTATETYSGAAAPAAAVSTDTDTTTVTATGSFQLTKQVQNLTQATAYGESNNALPGNTLQYLLTITNLGTQPVTSVVVNDTTPTYTNFLSAACPAAGTLPANLTACALTAQPAVGAQGALTWTFTGSLASGAQTSVSYQVQVAQ